MAGYNILSYEEALSRLEEFSPNRASTFKSRYHDRKPMFRDQMKRIYKAVLDNWYSTPGVTKEDKVPASYVKNYKESIIEVLGTESNLFPDSVADWHKSADADFTVRYDAKQAADMQKTFAISEVVAEKINEAVSSSNLKNKTQVVAGDLNSIAKLLRDNNWDWVLFEAYRKYQHGISVDGVNYKLEFSGVLGSNDVVSGNFVKSIIDLDSLSDSEISSLLDLVSYITEFTGEATVTDLAQDAANKFMREYIKNHATSSNKILSSEEQLELFKSKRSL